MNLLSNPVKPNNQKKTFKPQKAVFGVVLSVFLIGLISFGFGANSTKAQNKDIELADIKIKLDSYVNGQADNYFRIGKDGKINLSGTIRLLAPSSLYFNSDNIKRAVGLDGEVVAFGLAIRPKDTSSVCKKIQASYNYLNCDYNPVYDSKIVEPKSPVQNGGYSGQNLNMNDNSALLFKDTFVIESSFLRRVGVISSSSAGVRSEFYLYPFIAVSTGMAGDNSSKIFFGDAGKSIFVDLFDTQAQADDAAKNGRPNDIGSYGGTTGTPSGGSRSGIISLLNDVFTGLAQLIIEFVYGAFSLVVAPMLQSILSIRVYKDAFVNVIYPGWEVLRNICNIYFIIAIIAIAMGTLFRVESYKFKHLLVQLMIAALTVNFSLVIGQAILGLADTVQNQFLPNNVEVINRLARDLMPNNIKTIITASDFASSSFFATASTSLFFMALAIGSFLVFAGILIFLVIRIVMLWILLMVSPIAYAARVLPSTTGLQDKWWGLFLKYAFFTPIMAFFLNMTAIIAVNYEYVFREIGPQLSAGASKPGMATLILSVASNVLLLVFLIAALQIAEQFGIYGADKITEIAKKGMFAPFKMAAGAVVGPTKLAGKGIKTAAGFGIEVLSVKTGVQWNPKKWIEGWKHSREENRAKREALTKAKAESRKSEFGRAFGDPTSFFQRYWNIHTAKRLLAGGDKEGQRLLKEARDLQKQYKDNQALAADHADKWTEATRKEKLELYRKKIDAATRLLAPVNYHTQKDIRSKVDEEKNKVHSKTWEELYSLFKSAVEEKEVFRAMGVFKRVTETWNENEFINSSHYVHNMKAKDSAEWKDELTKGIIQAQARKAGVSEADIAEGNWVLHNKGENFVYSRHGAENFRKEILEHELGLGEQTSMRMMSDISDIAEDKNHRVLMRMYGTDETGQLYFKDTKSAEAEVRAENNKLSAEQMINHCNRLVGFIEIPRDDYDITGERDARITGAQLAYYIEHPSDIEPLIRRGRINTSQAKAFAENYKEIMSMATEILSKDTELVEDPMAEGDNKGKVIFTKLQLFDKAMRLLRDKGLNLMADAGGKTTIDKTTEILTEKKTKTAKGEEGGYTPAM